MSNGMLTGNGNPERGVFDPIESGISGFNFLNPDGTINYPKFLEYLRSQGVSDLSEIMSAGTPGEYDLTALEGIDRDSPLAQIYASIIGRAEDVDPRILADEQGRNTFIETGIGEVAQQIADAGGFNEWLEQQDEVILGDPGQINEDTTRSPVETIFEDDGTITTIIDPTLVTFPPLIGVPEVEGDGGGGSATAEEGEEETEEADTVVPDYSDLVNTEFEVPEPTEGEVGIPEFYRVDQDGNVTVILDPDNPVVVPPDRIPEHVDTSTPGTYPESGYVTEEQEETTSPALSGPNIVITPSLPGGGNAGGGDNGTDQTSTGGNGGGTGTGQGTGSGSGTGDGDGDGDGKRRGMFEDKFTPFMTSIGYTPVQLQQLVTPPKKDYMRELDGLFGRLLG